MKTCCDCDAEKSESAFPHYPNGKPRPRCKECANAMVREFRKNGPKRIPVSDVVAAWRDPAAVWATRAL